MKHAKNLKIVEIEQTCRATVELDLTENEDVLAAAKLAIANGEAENLHCDVKILTVSDSETVRDVHTGIA